MRGGVHVWGREQSRREVNMWSNIEAVLPAASGGGGTGGSSIGRCPFTHTPHLRVPPPTPPPSIQIPSSQPLTAPPRPQQMRVNPAHDADFALHRARGACPHAHSAQAQGFYALSHAIAIRTNYQLTLFRTCAGSTFVRARDGGCVAVIEGDDETASARGRTPVMVGSEHGAWCSTEERC